MARRDSNMIEASLLPPPTVEQFIAALKAAVDKPHVGGNSELYVKIEDEGVEVEGNKGTKGVRLCAVKAVLDFEVVRQAKSVVAASLDDYFRLFAKFVVDPALMTENVDAQGEIGRQREAMCQQVRESGF
jgi:hypothetical protein